MASSGRRIGSLIVTAITVSFAISWTAMTGCGAAATQLSELERVGTEASCKEAKDPLNPLIVEWSATNKVSLESASQRGIVMVSFDHCNLRVVSTCSATGSYKGGDIKPERHAVDIKDHHDLMAFLPIAAPKIGASLSSGNSLSLDYVTVSERVYEGSSVEAKGDCDAATHFVKRIRLGAYTLSTHAHADGHASADLGPLTVGGAHRESDQRDKSSGDPGACEANPEGQSCEAPLGLELVPLSKGPPRPGSDTMMLRDR